MWFSAGNSGKLGKIRIISMTFRLIVRILKEIHETNVLNLRSYESCYALLLQIENSEFGEVLFRSEETR